MKRAKALASLLGLVVAGGMAMGMAMKDPFAGKWKVTLTPEGGAGKELKDVLTFQGGKMTADELKKKGWDPAEYEDDIRVGGIAKFKCTLKHKSEGEMAWEGQLAAADMRGTVVWKKSGGEEVRYTLQGSKN